MFKEDDMIDLRCNCSFLLVCFVLLFAVSASGQRSTPTPKPPPPPAKTVMVEEVAHDFLGIVSEGGFKNDFFGLELQFPVDWTVIDDETSKVAVEIGTDMFKGDDERSNRALEDSTRKEVVLLHLARKPMGSLENCSFMLGVMKQPNPKVLPAMVAEATKSLLMKSPNLRVIKETRTGAVGGQRVAMVDYEFTVGDQKITILYYVAMVKGYAISFSATYINNEDLKSLEDIISSMRFKTK